MFSTFLKESQTTSAEVVTRDLEPLTATSADIHSQENREVLTLQFEEELCEFVVQVSEEEA